MVSHAHTHSTRWANNGVFWLTGQATSVADKLILVSKKKMSATNFVGDNCRQVWTDFDSTATRRRRSSACRASRGQPGHSDVGHIVAAGPIASLTYWLIRVTYKLGWMVYKCLHGQAPDHLSELCMLVAQVAEWQHLCSASRNLLVAPRFQLNTYGRHAFVVAATATWNSRKNCDTRISTVPPSDATWRRFCFNNTGCIECIRGAVRLCAI